MILYIINLYIRYKRVYHTIHLFIQIYSNLGFTGNKIFNSASFCWKNDSYFYFILFCLSLYFRGNSKEYKYECLAHIREYCTLYQCIKTFKNQIAV